MGNNLVINSVIIFGVIVVAAAGIQAAIAAIWGRGLLFRTMLCASLDALAIGMVTFWVGQAGVQPWTVGLGVVVGLPAALGVLYVIQRTTVGPVVALTQAAQQLAEGDLSVAVTYQNRDEVGRLANALREMVAYQQAMAELAQRLAEGDLTLVVTPRSDRDVLGQAFARMTANLHTLVGQVAENAAGVSAASEQLEAAAGQSSQATTQIAATMQQVAKGTSQQTESVTKTVYSVEGMKRAIDGMAQALQEVVTQFKLADLDNLNGQAQPARAARSASNIKSKAAGRRPEMALPSGNGHRRADGSRRAGNKLGAAA